MKKCTKSFDWYIRKQRFSIRKFHFGAASVLLGISLVLGARVSGVSADELSTVSSIQEVVVSVGDSSSLQDTTSSSLLEESIVSPTSTSELWNEPLVSEASVSQSSTDQSSLSAYQEEIVEHAKEQSIENKEGDVVAPVEETLVHDTVETAKEVILDKELISDLETEIVTSGPNSQSHAKDNQEITDVSYSETSKKLESEGLSQPANSLEEVSEPAVERVVSIPYKVVQRDIDTGEEKKLGQVSYASVTTSDEVAKVEVTVTVDKLYLGYRLADDQMDTITKVVEENKTNILSFAVTRKKDEKDNPLIETKTEMGGDSEGTSGFRAVENATRSTTTASYVTTEWIIPDDIKAANTGLDQAAGKASVTETNNLVPDAYKTAVPSGREVFMVLSLDSQSDPNKTTTFNKKYNKDYFFQFSIDKEGDVNKVYADLVDKGQNNKILETVEISQGSTGKFTTLAQYESDSYVYSFQFTPDPSNSTSKNLKINNPNGGNTNTIIYDKVSPKSAGTELNIFNVLVPVRTSQETNYVIKATDKRSEETLATYIQKGALTGDSYTIAGALDFDKYELIAEDVPNVLKGDLAADYKVGAKTIQSIMTHNLVRVLEVTRKDGTHRVHIYLLNPDGPNRLALDRKTNITEADLTSENFIKFFTSEEIVPGKVNTLEGSYSYTSKHQFESYKTNPHTKTNVITGETNNFNRNGTNFSEGNFFIPEHQAVTLKGKDGKPFGFGGVQMRMVNDNVANEQHVTYYYAEKGSVIIHYVNDKGETLKRSATLVGHGATGEQYDTRNYKHSSVTTGDGAAIDQYYLRRIDPSTSTLRPVTEDPNELRRIVKIDAETGVVERDTVKELTYVYEKAAKALMEIYLRPVDVETGNVAGPDKLSHTIREQGEKGTIISKRITLDILQTYIDKGYEVISDGFSNKTTYFDSIEDGVGLVAPSQVYKIILRERIKTVTPDAPKEPNTPIDPTNPTGPKYPDGVKATDLNETVKRTIKYQYEDGSEARPTVEETLTFTRTAKVNVVTGALAYTPWTSADNDFNEVVSPIIDGYEADKLIVEAVQDVPATDPDTEVIVRYVKDAQKATITYQDEAGKQLGEVDQVTGKSAEPINYTTTARITELTNQGYEVVRDDFTKDGGQIFDTDKASDQTFTVVVKARVVTVTPEDPKDPGTEVDPGNPDGPEWPDGVKASDLNQTVTRVIKYQYEDGSKAKDDVVEILTYKRTASVNLVTKEVTYGDWISADDDFDKVDTPAIAGYTPDKASVEAVQDVPATDPDTEVIVRYVKDAQKATITYQDEGGQQLGAIDEVTGKSGEPINYSTTARVTELTNQGYEVVRDDFTKDGGQVFDTDKASDQSFTVVVKAKTVTVTPEDPKDPGTEVDPGNPDGPKWPDGVKATDLNEEVVRTIKYQYEDGSEAQPDVVETLTYKRTATVNLVTKEVTYGDWTSADDDFDKVDTPAIAGYTPDKASVEAVQDVPATDPDTEVIVRYVKDAQKATITYQDEGGQQLGAIDEVTGKSGEPINYSTTDRIKELTNQGYEVVRDDFTKDGGQVFDTDKASDQTFTVVVKAKTVTVTPEDPKDPGTEVDPGNPDGPKWPDGVKESDLNQTVTRTIKYQYEDGSKAKDDVVETLTYKRTATVNLVTKEVTYGEWTSTDDDFDKVDTPAIAGYTPDKASVEPVQDVPATDPDTEVIVRYVKDAQKATITYQDDTGKQLGAIDEVTGKSGEPISYSTTARITELTNQGYEVVRDGFTKDGGQVFDMDKATDQTFTVVVKAKTVTVTPEDPKDPGTEVDPGNPDGPEWPDGVKESDLNQTVTRVIKYQYEDGSEAQPDVVETLTYKRTATVNLVTKEVTYGDWTSTDDDFDKVDTPAIAGYTPDKASVAAEENILATAADTEVIVTYVKDAQKATITYQDEGGQQLGAIDEVTGKSGESINYSTTARITELINQGYEVVRDDFTKDGGQVFDMDKATDQTFTVVVKARVVTVTPEDPKDPGTKVDPGNPDGPEWPDGIKASDLNQTVTRTIKYQYEDGSEAQPDVVETLTYKRTATVNLVTKEVTYGDWISADDDFDKVDTPAIAGYTPDKASVAAVQDVPATDPDTEVIVRYVKDVQKATITYQDEGGQQLGTIDEVTGKSGESINYSTTARITELTNQGYEVVTDGFTKDGGQVFDTDKASDQSFTVVVKARVVTVTPEDPKDPGTEVDPGNPDGPEWPDGVKASDLNQTVTRTIKYQYEDGSEAQPDVVETLTYKRTATVNLVTKEVTYGDWTSTDDDFDKVDTPAIAGYTPDKASVEAVQDVPATDPDTEVIVRYVKDSQKATITYQDDTGKQLGAVDEVTGKSGEPISYTTTARITELTNQGYEVVTDGFTQDGGQVFDTDKASDQSFTVVVKARVVTVTPEDPKDPGTEVDPGNPDGPEWPDGVKASDLNQTVTRTIKYQYEDGSKAKDDVVETLTYKRTATVNLVTKEVTYGDWTSADDDFDKVDTPVIAGYTPDKASIAAVQDVPATDPDTEVIVRYVKDSQKATITYQDDTGKQLGAVDEVTGKSGEPISYTTTARITELTNQGYEVVRDDFTKDGGQVFDMDKASDQSFTVVVKAKTVTVTPEDPKDPGTEVDPGNPDGPEWPDGVKESDLNQTVTRVIKYQYEDGSEAQPDVVETLTYKRTATVNLVTKEVTYGEWTSTDDDFDMVDTPAIAGYTPDKASVEAVQDVPATAPDTEVIVRYVKDAQKATITYQDEGGNQLGAVDEVTGKSGEPINYSTTARITELTNQGYEVVRDDFTKDGGQVFDMDKATDQSFTVVVKAKTVTVTPEDPKDPGTEVDPGNPDGPEWPDGVKATDLNEEVVRTIKYQYEDGSEAQPDVVETLTYKRTATVNLVTKEVTYGEWTSTDDDFDMVDTPAIAGYTPDKASVETVQDVPATDPDTEVIVRYVKDSQKATITYQDDTGKQLGAIDEVTGKSGEPINYSTTARITELTSQGYEVVRDDFTKDGGQVFDTDKATDQAFTVVVKAKTVTVTPEDPKDPGTEVDPGNPDGPEWPDGVKESDLNQTVTRVIKYQYEDGSEAQPDVVETLTYKRTATVNLVTKEVTYGEWTSTDDDFDMVDTPAIAGYTPDKASVEAVQDVPATDPDTEVIVRYVKDVQKATITYQDEGGNQLGAVDEVTGKSGEAINYSTTARITELTNQGYEVVRDDFTKDGGQVFDMDKATDQSFTVVVKAKTVTVTPEDPKDPGTEVDPGNPDGPEWPDGVKANDLNKSIKRTIIYVNEDGTPVLDQEGSPVIVTQTVAFKRSATVNIVTGEVSYSDWSAAQTVPAVSSPVVQGRYTETMIVSAHTFNATDSDQTITVVYKKLGSWVPTVPTGVTPIPPIPYPNDPVDPSKPGTDLPVLPYVPGHIPVGPGGFTPLTPVDPSDPSKGYELPPVPSDPGMDTPITYIPDAPKEATVIVKYVDTNGSEVIPSETITGKVGDPYTTNGKMIPGYYLVEVPANHTGTISANGTTVIYVYGKLGSWVPTVPTGVTPIPPIPYPNDPVDPSKPGTDLPVLPYVPGHIPVGPDGFTPLTPVDPSDPSKGYELPPVPSDPGMDTPITYVPLDPSIPTPVVPKTVIPSVPTNPVDLAAPSISDVPQESTSEVIGQRTLPSTGESDSGIAFVAGIGLLLGVLNTVVKRRKED